MQPANILITDDGIVKLSDFGSATLITGSPAGRYSSSSSSHYRIPEGPSSTYAPPPVPPDRGGGGRRIGSIGGPAMAPPYFFEEDGRLTPDVCTLWYRAPEVLLHRDYSYPVDIWAFGCVVAELVLGGPFFPGTSAADQLDRIYKFFEAAPDGPGAQAQAPPSSSSSASSAGVGTAAAGGGAAGDHNGGSSIGGPRAPAYYHTRAAYKRARPMDVRERTPRQYSAIQRLLHRCKAFSDSRGGGSSSGGSSGSHGPHNSPPSPSGNSPRQIVPVDHNFVSLMEGVMTFNADNRIYAKDAITHGFFYKEPYPCTPIDLVAKLSRR